MMNKPEVDGMRQEDYSNILMFLFLFALAEASLMRNKD